MLGRSARDKSADAVVEGLWFAAHGMFPQKLAFLCSVFCRQEAIPRDRYRRDVRQCVWAPAVESLFWS